MAKRYITEDVPYEADIDPRLEALEEETEYELAGRGETRVSFRWGKEQLAIVKEAACAIGVPYQTYLKQAVFNQALSDLQRLRQAKLGAKLR